MQLTGSVKSLQRFTGSDYAVVKLGLDDATWALIRPKVTAVRLRHPADGRGWAPLVAPDNRVSVVGNCMGMVHEGQTLNVFGRWALSDKWGVQVEASRVEEAEPA